MPGQPRGDEKQHPSSFHWSDPRNLRLTFDRAAFMRCGVVPINQKSTNNKRDVNQFNYPPTYHHHHHPLRLGPAAPDWTKGAKYSHSYLDKCQRGKKKHCSRARDKSRHLVVPFISMSDRFKWRQIRIEPRTQPVRHISDSNNHSQTFIYSALNVHSGVTLAYCSPYTTLKTCTFFFSMSWATVSQTFSHWMFKWKYSTC